jgi:hypothetical protein
MNVASAAKPWATGTSPASLSRGRREAGNGSASRLAIFSSVMVPSSAAGIAAGTAAGAGGTATGKGVHKVTVQTPRAMAPVTTVTPNQASRSRPVPTKPSQTTSPVRAALAWPNTTAGGTPTPVARCRRRPPRFTQVRSM